MMDRINIVREEVLESVVSLFLKGCYVLGAIRFWLGVLDP